MRHAMPVSFLILATFSIGTSADVAASVDKVQVASTGVLVKGKKTHKQPAPVVDVPDTPFEIGPPVRLQEDGSLAQTPKANVPVANTPFEMDPSFSPFEIDDAKSAASDLQAEAKVRNDSPFVLDSELPAGEEEVVASQKDGSSASPFTVDAPAVPAIPAAPKAKDDGPFVMEAQATDANVADKDEDAEDAKLAQTVTVEHKAGEGAFKIVRSGVSEPGIRETTTSFVFKPVEDSMETTTDQPNLRFELEASLLETSEGKTFVPIPGTPFEVHKDIAASLPRKGKAIELVRPPVVLVQSEPKLVTAQPHLPARMMRHDVIDSIPSVSGTQSSLAKEDNTTNDDNFTDTQDAAKNSVAANSPPIHSSNAVNTPGTHPSVQLPPADSNPGTPSNGSAGSDVNATASSISVPIVVGGNASANGVAANGTVVHQNKRVSARGAFVSITLGLIITIFFLSIVLCILNAGRKENLEPDHKDSQQPRPTPSYRQMMIAQQQPDATAPTTA